MTTKQNDQQRCEVLSSSVLAAVHGGGTYNCADADGIVPEYYGRWGGSWLGYAAELSRSPCQRAIYYDTHNMRGAGPNDWARLIAHERAHTRGFDHGEGSPSTNPAHSPTIMLTGR